jgi:hypothetical protein
LGGPTPRSDRAGAGGPARVTRGIAWLDGRQGIEGLGLVNELDVGVAAERQRRRRNQRTQA